MASMPALRRGVRRQFDATRQCAILMAPERVIVLDEIGDAIIASLGPAISVDTITKQLAERFDATPEEVGPDVLGFLQELSEKGLLAS
jgi:pyrroloquinoline quinone biosynthesis protein D